jgi:type I restriction enzyme M protein
VFPIALANLVLHGIDQPNLWHGNTLSGAPTYDALFEQAPATFDVILANPPFGGKEGKEAQKNYSFETSSTQVLFMQHILAELKPALDGQAGGRCAKVERDTRTPRDILDSIAAHGQTVVAALQRLRTLTP